MLKKLLIAGAYRVFYWTSGKDDGVHGLRQVGLFADARAAKISYIAAETQ